MSYADLHPEDVKATIRKRFKTLNNFERLWGLPHNSVNGLLRGKPSKRVGAAIDAVLAIDGPFPEARQSQKPDSSRTGRAAHRINARAS